VIRLADVTHKAAVTSIGAFCWAALLVLGSTAIMTWSRARMAYRGAWSVA